MKNVETDVNRNPFNPKTIMISASFPRHFDPHSKKETKRNKSQIAKCKILDWQSKPEKCLETKHFSFNGESIVIEVLRKIFFKTLFVCLFVCILAGFPFGSRMLDDKPRLMPSFYNQHDNKVFFRENCLKARVIMTRGHAMHRLKVSILPVTVRNLK